MTEALLSPRGRVLVLMLIKGPATRRMIEEAMGLSSKSVERIVGALLRAGLVEWEVTRTGGQKWWRVKEGVEVAEVLLQDAQDDQNGR